MPPLVIPAAPPPLPPPSEPALFLAHQTVAPVLAPGHAPSSTNWSIAKSSSLYKIPTWGAPYFCINAAGHLAIRPHGPDTKPNQELDIINALATVRESGLLGDFDLPSPIIFRFPDVLKDRLERLQSAFDISIRTLRYHGCFQGVFPVKCNQDRFVVENIVEFGRPYAFGLEAGSKPELLLAMASLCKGSPDSLLVCNGYKDADYVCLALMARQLRLNCVIVLEQEEELDVVLKMSRHLGIEPVIGVRAKLNAKHAGHFGETSGENGKFGLSCSQIVAIVNKLHKLGMLGCLQLLHFHIGSQIPSLAIVNDGVSEAAHIYCELSLMGANMKFIDIGGGLGIDYDGSSSAESDMSVGYTMEEYAKQVVQAVKAACAMKGVKEPTLCSESGRALVSHHSVLVFDVLSAHEKGGKIARDQGVSLDIEGPLPEELNNLHNSLTEFAKGGDYEKVLDCARQLKLECIDLFKHGQLSLMQLASANSIYEVASTIMEEREHTEVVSAGTLSLVSPKLFDPFSHDVQVKSTPSSGYNTIYHINLSIFKSMPDAWAIGQLFPLVPLHRLHEKPTRRAILSDLTCDSDGKVTSFVGCDSKGQRMNYLKVHELEEGKPYYMGMFLGGAYQEALGGMHNLFGAPPVVHVLGGSMGTFKVVKMSSGQTAADVLHCMQYEPCAMLDNLTLRVQKCLKDGSFGEHGEAAAMAVIHTVACSFASSTYLSTNSFNRSVVHNLFQPTVVG